MGKPREVLRARNLALYERVVAGHPAVALQGVSLPYTAHNGHRFSFLTPEGHLALRLPPAERARFLAEHRTSLVEQDGRILDEYVAVPDALLADTARLRLYFDLGFEYVAGLA